MSRLVKNFSFAVFAVMLIAAAGCLPDGEPPEGHIVHNPTVGGNRDNVSIAEAVEIATVELINFSLQYAVGEKFEIDSDSQSFAAIRHAFDEAGRISGITYSEKGKYKIISRFRNKSWHILIRDREKIYSEVTISIAD